MKKRKAKKKPAKKPPILFYLITILPLPFLFLAVFACESPLSGSVGILQTIVTIFFAANLLMALFRRIKWVYALSYILIVLIAFELLLAISAAKCMGAEINQPIDRREKTRFLLPINYK